MAHHHTTRPDLTDRLRAATTPADIAGNVVPIHGMRRVRRWDEPQPPDPYPERPTRHPGVRQSDEFRQSLDWEFKNGLPVTGPVVDPATPVTGRVITTPYTANRERHPFAATPVPSRQRRAPRLTWWAAALSVAAQSTVTAALRWGDAEPLLAAAVSVGMLLCSLLLIGAEQITGRCHR